SGVGVLIGSSLGGLISTITGGIESVSSVLLHWPGVIKLMNRVSGLGEKAAVGAGLGIRGGVLREISTKGELGKEFLQGGKLITIVSSLYESKEKGSSRSSGSNWVVIDQWVIKEEVPSRRKIGDIAKLLRLGIGR
ncbi:4646_t:CDS:2, partial [Gigaspora margarita]